MSELFIDIEWFAYNFGITSLSHSIKKISSQLVKYVLEDFRSIKVCVECYNNAFEKGDSSFIIPCQKPHLLVWADAELYGFWPAKVIQIYSLFIYSPSNHRLNFQYRSIQLNLQFVPSMKQVNHDTINLRFFGDHTTENLALDSCFLYS